MVPQPKGQGTGHTIDHYLFDSLLPTHGINIIPENSRNKEYTLSYQQTKKKKQQVQQQQKQQVQQETKEGKPESSKGGNITQQQQQQKQQVQQQVQQKQNTFGSNSIITVLLGLIGAAVTYLICKQSNKPVEINKIIN